MSEQMVYFSFFVLFAICKHKIIYYRKNIPEKNITKLEMFSTYIVTTALFIHMVIASYYFVQLFLKG